MRALPLFLLLAACPGGDAKDTADGADTGADTGDAVDTGESVDTADTSDTEDTGTEELPVVCGVTVAEDWAFFGECPRMRTPCEIWVADEATCAFEVTYSSGMTMGMPYSFTVDGDTLTFGDDDEIFGCVATLQGPDYASGSCEDGCTFTLERR